MAFEIRVQYEDLDQVANRFANQAEEVVAMDRSVRQRMKALEDGGWIGRGAESFYEEMNDQVLPSVQRLRRALEQASELTHKIANVLHEAEDEAATYFRR
jgi:WXG100 family type VII secretion target